jgi:hypothetical protein
MPNPSTPCESCEDVIALREKVSALEAWRVIQERETKEIREVISQVKLLMNLSIGGGALAVINLILFFKSLVP